MSKANDEFKAGKFEQSLETVGAALAIKRDDPDAVALKQRTEEALTQKKNKEETQRKRNMFTAQIESVRAAIAGGDLADAREKLQKIDPSFKDDPALVGVNTELAKKQADLKAKDEYAAQLTKLREHIKNGDAQAAQKLLGDLEKSPVVDASLDNLKKKVTELVDEQKKIQNVDTEYKNLFAAGENFEKAGDEKKEPSDKLSSYEMALPKYLQAKNLKKGGEADAKVTAIQNKITKAKADEEQGKVAAAKAQKEKEDREAQLKFNQKQFDDRLQLAQAAIKAGDFATAQANIDDANKLFKDDPRLKPVIDELKAKQGESDKLVNTALDSAASKTSKRQFTEALGDLQTAAKTSSRRELTSAVDVVNQLKRIDEQASAAAKSYDAKLAQLDAKANGKGKNERLRVTSAQQRLQTLTEGALADFARTRFQNVTTTVQNLNADLTVRQRDLSNSVTSYEEALKERESPGDENPFKNDPKKTPPKKDDPKPNKNSGKNQGDVNPFE